MSPTKKKRRHANAGRKIVHAWQSPSPSIVVDGIRYMTLREWAEWKRVSYWTARRAKLRGEVPFERIGRTDRIPVRVSGSEARQ